MGEDRLAEIESVQLGEWYAGEWRTEYVEGDGDEPAYYRVKSAEGQTLATLPDWAGPIATLLADAHESVPELLAEVTRQRKVILRLTGGADAGIQRVRLHKSEAGDWRVRWMLDGRRKAKTFDTETEAQDWAKQLKAGAL
jgi:hypothetical protein